MADGRISLEPRTRWLDLRTLVLGLLSTAFSLIVLLELVVPPKIHEKALHFQHHDPAVPQWMGVDLDYKKLAWITETRPEDHLPALLLHFVSVVPPEWPFLFVGHPDNIAFMRRSPAVARLEQVHKLQFKELETRFNTPNKEILSQVMTDVAFYDRYAPTAEHLLIWQSDSILCSKSEQSLNDWLHYDWVGAPWFDHDYGGNGGLSLRNMNRVRRVLRDHRRAHNSIELEDLWFVNRMRSYSDNNVPARDALKNFSVEGVWDEQPLAYHIGGDGKVPNYGDPWHVDERFEKIKKWCPEVKLILPTLRWPEADYDS